MTESTEVTEATDTSESSPAVRRRLPRDESMSATVVAAVAEAAGRETGDVQPLYTVMDPDVLDALFSYGQARSWEGHLTFGLDEFEVTVHASGEVVVRPRHR